MKTKTNNLSRHAIVPALAALLASALCSQAALAGGPPSEELSRPLNGWERICEGVDLSPTATTTFVDPMTRRTCRYLWLESQARARVENSSAKKDSLIRVARRKD